ncbi:MAG: 4'-phosphopantetheinyl transferase superfamily protein [Myxococcota bacterium]
MEALLAGLLPDPVHVAGATITDRVADLFPEEHAFVERAVEKRRHEFATGRVLARGLLARLGHPDFPILREDDRIPVWPDGIVGSISHAGNVCLAAAAAATGSAGIGIDLEPDEPVDSDIERVVCRDGEHAWVAEAGDGERPRRTRIVFSVKEAVYKAFYPRTRTFWSFQDVRVEIDLEAEAWRAFLPESAGVAEACGRVARREGWIVSAIALPPVA